MISKIDEIIVSLCSCAFMILKDFVNLDYKDLVSNSFCYNCNVFYLVMKL